MTVYLIWRETMIELIGGNACTLIATLIDAFSGSRKSARSMLFVQCISQIFYALGAALLKGYSAVVQNLTAILRNLYAAGKKSNRLVEWLLILLPVVLGLIFNNRGALGLLPVVANLEYSLFMFLFKGDAVKLKFALIINCAMFAVFYYFILNYVGMVMCCIIISSCVFSLAGMKKAKQMEKTEE